MRLNLALLLVRGIGFGNFNSRYNKTMKRPDILKTYNSQRYVDQRSILVNQCGVKSESLARFSDLAE